MVSEKPSGASLLATQAKPTLQKATEPLQEGESSDTSPQMHS